MSVHKGLYGGLPPYISWHIYLVYCSCPVVMQTSLYVMEMASVLCAQRDRDIRYHMKFARRIAQNA